LACCQPTVARFELVECRVGFDLQHAGISARVFFYTAGTKHLFKQKSKAWRFTTMNPIVVLVLSQML
jgi:hypothetical protein